MTRGNLSIGALARRWAFAVAWGSLALTAGPALADALDPRRHLLRSTASIGLWAIWAVTLGAALVPRTVTLTAIRIVAPAAVVASLWAAVATPSLGIDDAVAL